MHTEMVFSVRFFKRMILVVLALLIIIPICVSIGLGISLKKERGVARDLSTQLEKTQQQLTALLNTDSIGSVYTPPAEGDAPEAPIGAEAMPYQLLFPDLYSKAEVPAQRVKAQNTVYLTFDDGPSVNTRKILDALDEAQVKATFFTTAGELSADNVAELLREIRDRGHTIGIHSYSHEYLKIYESIDAYLTDFNRMYEFIYEATGLQTEIFRFPGGSINSYDSSMYQPLIGEMLRRGFVFYDWNVTGGDTLKGANATSVVQTVRADMNGKSRGIVLLHDSNEKGFVAEALPEVIATLKEMGYAFEVLTPSVLPIVFSYNSQA